ncbi:DUF309 domain-containing protein [Thalassobacillus devorans]|uniref:DUF309 domain-containing protein n=1 Tax=Thalassobacillus devorans TaxID=279813 RepID=UPI00048FF783|nr:DUF309 domain-containing protein [Thalassobacillus devorans]
MCNSYPMAYYEFFISFNEGDYYTCHDLLEEIWLTDRRNLFIKGMLHFCVALYHYSYGNLKGSRSMLLSARQYLSRYDGIHWGITIHEVISFINDCLTIISQLPTEDARVEWSSLPCLPHFYLYLK